MTVTPNAYPQIFQRLAKTNPTPTTELIYHSHFELLVAVMLSAQTLDKSVNKVTRVLFQVANTPETLLALGEVALRDQLKTLNFYRTKAKHLIITCDILLRQHDGRVPKSRADLEALPGVGRKTANVIRNTCFDTPDIAVDTHVFRVAKRVGLTNSRTLIGVETQLCDKVPHPFRKHAHHWLVLHGRYVCLARKPKCHACVLYDLCCYPGKS